MTSALVPFHDEQIPAVQGPDGTVWTPLTHFCERLGIDASSQHAKLRKKKWASMVLSTMETPAGPRQVMCISNRTLPMWLATLNTKRVSEAARQRLDLYQCEAAEVLARHFLDRAAPSTSGTVTHEQRFSDADLTRALEAVRGGARYAWEVAAAVGVGEVEAARRLLELRTLSLAGSIKGAWAPYPDRDPAPVVVTDELGEQLLALLRASEFPLSSEDLRVATGHRRSRVVDAMRRLQRRGAIQRSRDGGWVPVTTQPPRSATH